MKSASPASFSSRRGGEAELARLLDRVRGVRAAVRERDDFGVRGLGLKQEEGTEIGRVQRVLDGLDDLASRDPVTTRLTSRSMAWPKA